MRFHVLASIRRSETLLRLMGAIVKLAAGSHGLPSGCSRERRSHRHQPPQSRHAAQALISRSAERDHASISSASVSERPGCLTRYLSASKYYSS